jgi:hypothetical protein
MKTTLTLHGCFPLTLTLSLGEREQPMVTSLKSDRRGAECRHGLVDMLGALLPLSEEEGRGEGKRDFALETQTI